jgi:hypothetical protein
MSSGYRRGAAAAAEWNKTLGAGDLFWRFRRGLSDVVVLARAVGTLVEVSTQVIIDDEVRTLDRQRFKRSTDLIPHLLATKQGFLQSGWVSVETSSLPRSADAIRA